MPKPYVPVGKATIRRTTRNTPTPQGRSTWLDISKLQERGFMEPAEFLVRVYNDERAPRVERMDAAKALLKHMYTTMPNAPTEGATTTITHESALDLLDDAEVKELLTHRPAVPFLEAAEVAEVTEVTEIIEVKSE